MLSLKYIIQQALHTLSKGVYNILIYYDKYSLLTCWCPITEPGLQILIQPIAS